MPRDPGSIACSRPWRARARRPRIRLVQGSHIVVPRLYEHDRCYVFQNADRPRHLRDPVRARLHPHRHHRARLSRRPGRGGRQPGGDRLPLRRGQRVLPGPDHPGRRRVDVLRGAPALRRRHARRARRDARLRAGARRAPGRPGAAERLRRQDHHVPRSGAERRRQDRPLSARAACPEPSWSRDAPLPGGDFPRRRLRGIGGRPGGRPSVSGALPPAPPRAVLWHQSRDDPGGRAHDGRSRAFLRRRPHRARGTLSHGPRVGSDGG